MWMVILPGILWLALTDMAKDIMKAVTWVANVALPHKGDINEKCD